MLQVGSRDIQVFSSPMTIKGVEDKIRNAVQVRHARTSEYLKDFDRLRTGYMTQVQLKRCLDQHYGIVLNEQEEGLLMRKYGSDKQKPGMFNYRDFCETIDAGTSVTAESPKAPGKTRLTQRRPVSPEVDEKCQKILQRIAQHYEYHGISIKSCYEDFDRHNIGTITESQFYRSFPGPQDVLESEMRLLGRKYRHPIKDGMCNYLDFHEDILNIQNEFNESKNAKKDIQFDDGPTVFAKNKKQSDLQDIFDKIRVAVHKNGIRTTEFFKDHDKLRSGVITENQFVCGLSLCCSTQANLTREEIQTLVSSYQMPDGRVRYKGFCDAMENAFTVPNLEKHPTATVFRPKVGELAKVPNTLSLAEEDRVIAVMDNLREIVLKKRLMMYPYFKDFDRAKSYTRGITRTQFGRMLHMVGLDVSQPDLELLCRKFDAGGDVYYPAFIQAIDSEYIGTAVPKPDSAKESSLNIAADIKPEQVDLEDVIGRIRHHVLVNSLRIEEFFQDFDPLRHGSISQNRFRMGLSTMGPNLSEAQFNALAKAYADPKRPGDVLWNKFLLDVEIVFTKRGMEKTPRYTIAPSTHFVMDKTGTVKWGTVHEEKRQLFESTMERMREIARQRRILAKPCFQDFDRHNQGYVTRSQFCQCLTTLCLSTTNEETAVIIEKFSDDTGFNYIRFLEELQPSEKTESKYLQRLKDLELVNNKKLKDSGSKGIENIMNKIKTKVVKERMRVVEFMRDYDKLRTGRLLKTVFPRAIDLCNLGLVRSEVEELMKYYQSPSHPDYVNYTAFCDDVESVFTVKGLEKNPLYEVTQFQLPPEGTPNKLAVDTENRLDVVMHRLADRVRVRRMQMFPLFEDFDNVHNGSVSRSQFHRVLSELELVSLVDASEFDVLYEKFDILVGGKHDFNYVAFCDMINEFAQFEYRKP